MNTKGTLSESDWRDGFPFLANDTCLDFVNTRPEVVGERKELLADWSSLMRWFRAAKLIDVREGVTFERAWAQSKEAQKTLKAMWAFRENLQKDLLCWEGDGRVRRDMIRELNTLMLRHPMLNKITSGAGKLVVMQWFPLRQPSDLFAPLGYGAARLFSEKNPERVRKCEHCVLHFHDTSKIGTRRWCSMRLCGNRAKVAAYAARKSARSD